MSNDLFFKDLRKKYFRNIVFGSSQSGKTYWLFNNVLPQLKDLYKTIIIFTKKDNNTLYKLYLDKLKFAQPLIYNIDDDIRKMIKGIYALQENNKSADGLRYLTNILIIFDDILDKKLFNSDLFLTLFTSSRHKQISTILLTQVSHDIINAKIKGNTSFFTLFNINNDSSFYYSLALIQGSIRKSSDDDLSINELRLKAKNYYNKYIKNKPYGSLVISDNATLYIMDNEFPCLLEKSIIDKQDVVQKEFNSLNIKSFF